ncbi:MAG TPA: EamA family transporter [Burkholderiales bacterium]
MPRKLLFRLALAIVLDTAVQLLWKVAALQLPALSPLLLLVAALFGWQLLNWLRVLESSDLSYSQPITALSLVTVFILSALYLGESVDLTKILGTGFVLAGVWFISRTDYDSGSR